MRSETEHPWISGREAEDKGFPTDTHIFRPNGYV